MSNTRHLTTSRKTVLAGTATAAAVAGLLLMAGSPVQAETRTATMTQGSLLGFDQIGQAGLPVDSAELGTRGDQYLGDAGRFDEGCLWEKTMRNITGAKAYPAPGQARVYVDATWTNTRDKDVWLSESIAQGKSTAKTDRYIETLFAEIRAVRSCEEDPDQGHYYGPAHTVKVGTATATYFVDHESDGSSDGGGAAVVRDGDRFGYVNLMFGRGKPGTTLKKLAVAAARDLR